MEPTTEMQTSRHETPRRPFATCTNVPPPAPRKRNQNQNFQDEQNHRHSLFVPEIPNDGVFVADGSPSANLPPVQLKPRLGLSPRDPPGDLSNVYRRDPSGRMETAPLFPDFRDNWSLPGRTLDNGESESAYIHTLSHKRSLARCSFR